MQCTAKQTLLACSFVADLPHQDLDLQACQRSSFLRFAMRRHLTSQGVLSYPVRGSLLWVIVSVHNDTIVSLVDEMRAAADVIQIWWISYVVNKMIMRATSSINSSRKSFGKGQAWTAPFQSRI